jgi:hypothetical protein
LNYGIPRSRYDTAFLADDATIQNSRSGEVSEGREAPRTAGLETGATIFDDP